jgi:hypothetical protein
MNIHLGYRRLALTGLGCWFLLAAPARPANAQLALDTLAIFNAPSTRPMIAVDRDDLTPHVGFQKDTALIHSWLGPGGWQSETAISPFTTYTTFNSVSWDATSGARVAVAWDDANGSLLFAARESGWTLEPVLTNAGWHYLPSLVLDWHDGTPLLAFVANEPRGTDPPLEHLELARRSGGVWTITELDTSSFSIGLPSLALTGDGEPRIAVCRQFDADGDTGGLYYIEAPAATGPFAWTRVDSEAAGYSGVGTGAASLTLDHLSDEPRIAYSYFTNVTGLSYGYRSSGVWGHQHVYHSDTPFPEPISLALTPAGDPRIIQTQTFNIFGAAPLDRIETGCSGGAVTRNTYFFKRAGAEGNAAFVATQVATNHQGSSARAVAPGVADGAQLVWRDPANWGSGCLNDIVYATDAPTTGVPLSQPMVTRFAIEPNPLVAGRTMTIRLALPRAQTVELTLIDIAGRRVASTEARAGAGASSLVWTPDGRRAGVYRVIARAGGARIGSAPVVVLR